jgi:oligopeptidase B
MLIKLLTLFILSYSPYQKFIEVNNNQESEMMKHPIAKKIPYSFEIHDTKIDDEYNWLRGKGWPEKITDKDILSYLTEENDYFNHFMDPLAREKELIFEELKGRVKLADQSTYIQKDDYYYYSRTEEDKDYMIYCRKHSSTQNPEEILLDVNKLAKGKKFTSIGAFAISSDHKLMAYSVGFTGGEKYIITIFDLENQKFLADEIQDTIGSIVWHENGEGFFYTPVDENWRHDKVIFHRLGTKSLEDQLIYHEKDPLYSVSINKSSSREFMFINTGGHDSTESYCFSMNDQSFTPILIKKRFDKILYSVDHGTDCFYMYTNDGAKNFKLLVTNDIKQDWQEYIKEDTDKYLSNFDLTEKYILLNYKHKGLPLIIVKELKNGKTKEINFPDESYTAYGYSTNFEHNDLRIDYSSLSRPNTVYQYSFSNEKLDILKVQEIPSGFEPSEYITKRIFAKSGDVEVPITLLYKKSLFKQDGSNPLYLYGYGSYGYAIPPMFRNSAISLVDRGFVFAIAHIRGGDDLGYDWYEAAKFLTKKRTFDDFIASAQKLIDEKYTAKGNIVIVGGSAGGMLIGDVINEKPELFKAAIAHVPFVDVLNTMLDESLPLTPGEFKEWGNPKEKEYFDYMKSYSPYDNVKAQNYPNIMVTAGLTDPRVGYWEAAKWVARLRDKKTDNNLIIFKTNMEFGHKGASARFDYLKEAADDIVFILKIFAVNLKI